MTETAGLYVSCLRPLCFMLVTSMFHACGLYVSCLRPLCFMLAASMFHTCGLYLRHMATIRGGLRLGRNKAIRGACCALWLWEAGLQHRGWVGAFGFVLLVVLFVVRSSVRAFGRSFRGSCFWSFFGFVLLVVLFVVRSFGGSYVFFVRCFKSLRGVCGKVRGFLMQR